MILHYIKVAIRSLMKFKMQNIIAILGLAMSLFCFSICLYCSRYIFNTDNCFINKDRILEINLYGEDGHIYSGTNGKLAAYLRNQNLSSDAFCAVVYPDSRQYNIEISEEKVLPYNLMIIETDSVFNEIFTPEILFGSWKQATYSPNSVILFESVAKRIFGTPEKAIGKNMILSERLWSSPPTTPREGGIIYTIKAVVKDLPLNNSLNFLRKTDALVINDSEGLINANIENVTGTNTFALAGDDKNPSKFTSEITDREFIYHIFDEEASIIPEKFGTYFWKYSIASYFGNITLIAGVLVLVVGLLNFLHFIIGVFFIRVRECNIRRVNGAGFKDMFMMFFVQISISILLSAFFTFLIIELLSPFLHLTLVRFYITIDSHMLMWQTFTYLMGLMGLCIIISLFVILKIRKSYVKQNLDSATTKYGHHRLRNISLGIQLFIGWVFISFAVSLYLQSVKTNNSVFSTLSVSDKKRILSIPLDYSFMNINTKKALVEEIRKCQGVEDVIISDINYLKGVSGTGLYLTEKRDNSLDANVMRVSPGFFKFMNVKIISGHEQKNTDEMVIDEVLAKRINKEVLGTILYDYIKGYTVVGIATPFVTSNYSGRDLNGFMFIPSDFSDYFAHCYVKCKAEKLEEITSAIMTVMRKSLPESVEVYMRTMMDDIREEHAMEFKLRGIILFMAVISLIISLFGIYSAITLDTEYRRKEMAIRKINGAGMWHIVMLFAKLYIVLILSTAAIAFPIVEFLLSIYGEMYYSFIDTGIMFYGGIMFWVIMLITLTVYVRIRDISQINPAEIIKNE